MEESRSRFRFIYLVFLITVLFFSGTGLCAQTVFSPMDVFKIKTARSAVISPDGNWIAYTVSVPRGSDEDAGSAWSELYLLSPKNNEIRPFITGKVNVSSPRWSSDSLRLAFLTKRGQDAVTQVWVIPVSGGEAQQISRSETDVEAYGWLPGGERIAYLAPAANSKREKELAKKGYGFIFFEENIKPSNLYVMSALAPAADNKPQQLTENIHVLDFIFSAQGKFLALLATDKKLVDYEYMFKKIYRLDVETRKLELLLDPQKKLGDIALSPNGQRMVFTAAIDQKDHAISQVYLLNLADKNVRNLTPDDFPGHVSWAAWRDDQNIVCLAAEGAWNNLYALAAAGSKWKKILASQPAGVVFSAPDFSRDFKKAVFSGSAWNIPADIFIWDNQRPPSRVTTLNPWLAERKLGRQEVVRYTARDGLALEGILVYPVDFLTGQKYPLIVSVHGGPEAHHANDWLSGYQHPAQVFAGKGYLVFYPNYRASTGYGVKFAAQGYNDAAGKEFDDIADGIEYLSKSGPADADRVGLGGGSYGGYAAAWFGSYYSRYVRAVTMFVGISDLTSKRLTTDIPYEELHVHSGKPLAEMWEQSLKRSPIYWAQQSKTAVLILGGANDTRVDPSQSKEFYRILKMNNHPAVRLVQYPGEGHGNRKQPGRIDFLHRHLQWYDWYVRDKKPLDGPMPSLDISDVYGLKLD
jgi:dipeptidyl aminopeptidase/acylaminoacyl peptidase